MHLPSHRSRPVEEEPDRVVLRQRVQGELALLRQVESNAACHEELDRRGESEQRGQVARRGEEMFQVVHDNEDLRVMEILDPPHPGRLRNGGANEGRLLDRGERDEEDAVGILIRKFRRDLQGEPCLAAPARPRDRDKTNAAVE